MNELLSTAAKRNVGQIVVRRAHYPFRRGLAPIWMEKLESRLLFAIAATPIDGGVRLDSGGGDNASAIAVQADGKILVGGYDGSKVLESGAGSAFVMRLNADHTIDTSFGDNGYAAIAFKRDVNLDSIVVQADGSILGSGAFYDNSVNRFDYGVFKLNANGNVDTSFGDDGLSMVDVSGVHNNNWGGPMSVDSQGRIVVLGYIDTPSATESSDGTVAYSVMQFVPELIRLTPDGQLDTSFGDGGHVAISIPGAARLSVSTSSVYALADDSIVVAGDASQYVPAGEAAQPHPGAFLAKFSADGSADASFGNAGIDYLGGDVNTSGTPGYDFISGVAEQSDGRLVVSEQSSVTYNTSTTNDDGTISISSLMGGGSRLLRLNADGSTDSSFTQWVVPAQEIPVPTSATVLSSGSNAVTGIYSNAVHINDDGTISLLYSKQFTSNENVAGPLSIGEFSSTGQHLSDSDFTPDFGTYTTPLAASVFTSADTVEAVGNVNDTAPPAGPADDSKASQDAYSAALDAWDNQYDIFAASFGGTQQAVQSAGDSGGSGDSDSATPATSLTANESSIFSIKPVQQDDDSVLAGPAKDTLTGDVSDSLDLVLTP